MENKLKPARIPLEFPAKFHKPRYFLLLMPIWCLPMYGMLLLDPPAGIILGFISVWTLFMMALSLLPYYYDLILFPEGIQVRLFGKVIQQIPVSELKYIFGIGNDTAHYLCLSAWSVEELAQLWEKNLQNGYFSKQDLPFMKRSPGWQERFAQAYLFKPDWRIANLHTRTPILWVRFDPVIAIYLRRMYPQLPYVDMQNPLSGKILMHDRDRIPFYSERYRVDETGVHILAEIGKEERRCFPAERIKTIFRLDRFVQMSSVEPDYESYLVVSELSLAELAERGKQKGWQKWKKQLIAQLPEAEQMYAVEFHFSGLFVWNRKTASDVHIMYTPENEALLRRLYPHAQWVDYSKEWQ